MWIIRGAKKNPDITSWVTFAAGFRNQNKKRALRYTFPLELQNACSAMTDI